MSVPHWPSRMIEGAIAIGSLAAIMLLVSCFEDLWTQTAAAWVQALGSIVAIIGAFLVARYQHQNERKLELQRQNDADLKKLEVVAAVVRHIDEVVVQNAAVREDSAFSTAPTTFSDNLLRYEKMLQSIPLLELPSSNLIAPVTGLTWIVAQLPQLLDREFQNILNVKRTPDHEIASIENLLYAAHRTCHQILNIAERHKASA